VPPPANSILAFVKHPRPHRPADVVHTYRPLGCERGHLAAIAPAFDLDPASTNAGLCNNSR
jgi:hypothetical protein